MATSTQPHTSSDRLATLGQVRSILTLIETGAHHAPGALRGPITGEDIAELTYAQAHAYEASLRNPVPAPPAPSAHAFTGTVKITVTAEGYSWAMRTPGAPQRHGTATTAREASNAILDAAQDRTAEAPRGWHVNGIRRATGLLHNGTYPMRPATAAEHQAPASAPSVYDVEG